MILDELILHRFGIYRDREVIAFASGSVRQPITLISALNGSGKTTVLDALRLALYGRRVVPSRFAGGYDKFLRDAIHRDVDPSDGASVTICFRVRTEGEERAFRVVREWSLRGEQVRERVQVSVNGMNDPAATEAWPDIVEQLLPLRLSAFCFFDGEKLEDLADADRSREAISEAVSSLLGLDLVDQLALDLKTIERRSRSLLIDGESDGDMSALTSAHDEADSSVQSALHDRGTAANLLERARLDLASVQAAFEQAGGALHGSRNQLAEDSRVAAHKHARAGNDLDGLAHAAAPLLLLRKQICAWSTTPPTTSAEVNQILATRDLDVVNEAKRLGATTAVRRALTEFLAADRAHRRAADEGTRSLTHRLRAMPDTLGRIARDVETALLEFESTSRVAESLTRQLQRIPEDASIRPLQQRLTDAMMREAEAAVQLRIADEILGAERAKRAKVMGAYTRALEQQLRQRGRLQESRLIEDRTQDLTGALEVFRRQVAARHAARLADLIGDCLAQLHRKKGLLDSVQVDSENFRVTLWDGQGREVLPERLSAGERQILAVATIWAILRASGRPLPLVVDTPLGRLDSVHRDALTDKFFAHASHQVVLLATDTEIDEATYRRLRPRVARSYVIVYDDATRGSRVSEGQLREYAV
jgi:DNA sulfur modification protein DndD